MIKKRYLIGIAILIILSLGLWVFYPYIVPPKLPTYEEKKVDPQIKKELGYVPGEVLIQLKPEAFDLSTNIGMRKFLNFLSDKSNELTPIIIDKLVAEGKLSKAEITDIREAELRGTLITFGRRFALPYGALLVIAFDNAAPEISEELSKDPLVEMATPNYAVDFSDLRGKPIPGTPN